MRLRLTIALVLASLLLAGCTRGGESSEADGGGTHDLELATYDGGKGIGLSITNAGVDRFTYTLRVLDADDNEKAVMQGALLANDTDEQWWSLDAGAYTVRMQYTRQSGSGSSSGSDTEGIDLVACPEVSRLSWRLMQAEGTVASAFLGTDCVSRDPAGS